MGRYLRLVAALCEIKRATLSRTQPSLHNGSCPGASAPGSGSITRPRAFSEGPSCAVNQLSLPRFSLPQTAHRNVPDWFGSFVVTIRRTRALTPRKMPPDERRITGHTKRLTLAVVLIKDHPTRLCFARCNTVRSRGLDAHSGPLVKRRRCLDLSYATADLASL